MSNIKLNEESSAKKIDKIKDQQQKIDLTQDQIRNLRKEIKQEVDYTMDGSVKQLFLNLTKMQIPFDYEHTLEEFFPKGMKKDDHGNYYIKIGDTKSMFCAHLDTYCYEYKRVWHTFSGDTIATDGTTTLGADDKAGVVVMIKMIESNVPGLYYFFRGEEGVTSPTGTWGSKQAIKSYKENFEKYDRCIAFDRKRSNSVITQQMYSACCSDEFAKSLIKDLGKNGLTYEEDDTGMWCDSGVFMETIPECTNISMGYNNEHTFGETQDIVHLEKLTNACINIDWENLPTKRDPSKVSYSVGRYNYDYGYKWESEYNNGRYKSSKYGNKKRYIYNNEPREYVTLDGMFNHVVDILDLMGYSSLNNDFEEAEEMYFQNYLTGDFFALKIIDFEIYMSEGDDLKNYMHIGDLDSFEELIKGNSEEEEYDENEIDTLDDYQKRHLKSISQEYNETSKKSDTTYKNQDDFTVEQNRNFKTFVRENPKLVEQVMEDIKIKNIIEVSPDTWLAIDKAMANTNNIVIDYGDHGINPDDFVDWLGHNWEECIDIIWDIEENGSKKEEYPIDFTVLEEADAVYWDIALNQDPSQIKLFIKQVINKGFVDDDEQYEQYEKSVTNWIKKKYSKELNQIGKNINYVTFIDWLIKHKDTLLEYYK